MTQKIIEILASIFAYAAAKGIDMIVGKWLAYATIAWEQAASQRSKEAFNQAMQELKAQSPDKAKAWDDWRNRAASSTGSSSVS